MRPFTKRLGAWLRRKPKPLPFVIVSDILLTGVALVIFALFHHVIPRVSSGLGVVSVRPGAAAAATMPSEGGAAASATAIAALLSQSTAPIATEIPMSTAEPVATADPVGYFGTKFADRFIEGAAQTSIEDGLATYVSENVNVKCQIETYYDSTCYITDIYVRDITNLATAFADGEYGKGLREMVNEIAAENGAIVAINGDYYGARDTGVVIRNGTLYRDDYSDLDVCVLYWDGTMRTFSPDEFDVDQAVADGAYQAWCFGPALLDASGVPLSDFNTDVGPHNPRTALGYYEPGHYCFVVVDGRSDESAGITIEDLANFMSQLGCKQAYNLDGGQTSVLAWGDRIANEPYKGGRTTSDIIMVVD